MLSLFSKHPSFVALVLSSGCATTSEGVSSARFKPSEAVAAISSPAEPRARQEPTEGHMHLNELAIAFGEFNEADETGVRIGIDYERRSLDGWTKHLDERWGIGAMIDFDAKPVESVLVAAQLVYHPVESVGLVLAPGYSFNDEASDSLVLRLGSRYAFRLSEPFTISPEIFYDIMEGGRRKGVLAIALGYGF